MPHRRDGFNLCDHDSIACVHFCQLEYAMLWRICALSSCIRESEGEDERIASLSMMSRLRNSVREGIMLWM